MRFPHNVYKTGYGWDESRSAYKVQIGNHEQTIAYAWVSLGNRREEDASSDAIEIANRMIEGWRDHPKHQGEAKPDLSDDSVVHLNMMRGSIAKLTPEQIGHLYRGDEALAVIAELTRQNQEAVSQANGGEE